ncbi:type IV secretion system protein [Rubrivirga litoralis]|uniref:Type IV secretion system protein n=1 Tax=Rubrivirga litoralis TaxID=3075598 RepID=A0ABU3BUJ4_9BACT|nr:type IV secretion system protein [Rubrivirga sp. F394]MDT0632947.1 type IV secretion system protein [Rubrivirga sp. F394]
MTHPSPVGSRLPVGPAGGFARRPAVRWALVVGCAAATVLLAPAVAAQTSSLDLITDDYRSAAESARPIVLGIARGTFAVLAVIEVALAGILWGLKGRGVADVMSGLALKLGWLGFVFALLASFDFWFMPIIDGFVAAGQRTSSGAIMNPGDILASGAQISTSLREGYFEQTSGFEYLQPSFWDATATVILSGIFIEFVYLLIAAFVVFTFVEAYVVLTTGALVIGFAAFRGTAGLADRFVAYAFAVGIRLFLLFFLVGIGQNIAAQWGPMLAADPTSKALLLQVLGGSACFGLIAIVIPAKVSSQLTSSLEPGFARALYALA